MGKVAKGVVLLVPTYNTTERCWSLFERALYRLDPLPELIIFATNNNTDCTLQLLNDFKLPHETIVFDREMVPKPVGKYGIIAFARQLLLTGSRIHNAKMAIFLDDDVIPPHRGFIQDFLDDNFDICVGFYYIFSENGRTDNIGVFWDSYGNQEDMPKKTSKVDLEKIRK